MRILVVDDNNEIREFLKSSFKAECFEVDLAEDGEQGSFLARTNDYDLIILDNILPKKNGKEVCRDIRADGQSVPILMLSIESEAHTKADLLNSGVDDYLSKPFSLEELIARAHALLRRPNQIQEEIIAIGDLVLDVRKHIVKCGKRELYLTVKEFNLLDYLMRNHGQVVSRGMILEHVWDMNADPFSNTIEAHISNLRRKIHLTGQKTLIQTVPGRGYKISI